MTTATISKEFAFSASHQLAGLPADHPCSRLHGHNYVIRLELTGEPDEVGFVVDYRRLDGFKAYIDTKLDHRHLNDELPFNPTAEHIAAWFADLAVDEVDKLGAANVHRLAVGVSETPKTWATVTRILHLVERDR